MSAIPRAIAPDVGGQDEQNGHRYRGGAHNGCGCDARGPHRSACDSFRIGTGGTIFCSAQTLATDPVLKGMFDAGYSLTCRDAALPVGKMFKLTATDAAERMAAARAGKATCSSPSSTNIPDLGRVEMIECKLKDADVGYRVYQYRKGKLLYGAEGLTGYDTALQLGLRSIVADQPVKGEISIATTGLGDPCGLARVQAGTLDPSKALAEAYRRNNAGSYAEAAEFFAAVGGSGDAPLSRSEALANEAAEVEPRALCGSGLIVRARIELDGRDPLVARPSQLSRHASPQPRRSRRRDCRTRRGPPQVGARSGAEAKGPEIDAVAAKRLNAESRLGRQLGAESDELPPAEECKSSMRRRFNCAGPRCG